MVEAVPTRPSGSFAEARQIFLPIVNGVVVLPWHVKHILSFRPRLQQLVKSVELGRLGAMRQIARMNNEFGGVFGSASILSIASCRVALTSALAGLLKPM
jgi:hypothetical protein